MGSKVEFHNSAAEYLHNRKIVVRLKSTALTMPQQQRHQQPSYWSKRHPWILLSLSEFTSLLLSTWLWSAMQKTLVYPAESAEFSAPRALALSETFPRCRAGSLDGNLFWQGNSALELMCCADGWMRVPKVLSGNLWPDWKMQGLMRGVEGRWWIVRRVNLLQFGKHIFEQRMCEFVISKEIRRCWGNS